MVGTSLLQIDKLFGIEERMSDVFPDCPVQHDGIFGNVMELGNIVDGQRPAAQLGWTRFSGKSCPKHFHDAVF